MNGADYIVDYLIKLNTTDAFGIPGGVVLDLLYAMNRREKELTPHLCYHEQAAGFAACGYAQASGKLGVAYATRGPGFTNMITPIADAFCDSVPVLFITAHADSLLERGMRVLTDQEIDTCLLVESITKYAKRVDSQEDLQESLEKACTIALEGRKGPVFLDIASSLFKEEMCLSQMIAENNTFFTAPANHEKIVELIEESIRTAERPVILIGDGINQANMAMEMRLLAKKVNIPILSSRFSHDIANSLESYFGYIGSHGIRYANFILSKADLIVSIGNRMCFQVESESFRTITYNTKKIRCEIDEEEFIRNIPNTINFQMDIRPLLSEFAKRDCDFGQHDHWIAVCKLLRDNLWNEDINPTVEMISDVLKNLENDTMVINDVGNNEFWVSRACIYTRTCNRVLYSKSFGSLGCAIGKMVGAYYATGKAVVCFVGDQGMQMNLQELQYLAQHKIPATIILLNNKVSGMIRDREKKLYDGLYLHTTPESGYGVPDFETIAKGYKIQYYCYKQGNSTEVSFILKKNILPCILEIEVSSEENLSPNLLKGMPCQKLNPEIEHELYSYLDSL